MLGLRWKMVSFIQFVAMVTKYVAMEWECFHAGNWGKDKKKKKDNPFQMIPTWGWLLNNFFHDDKSHLKCGNSADFSDRFTEA